MTVSIGNGVDLGNLVTSTIDPVTGKVGISASSEALNVVATITTETAGDEFSTPGLLNGQHLPTGQPWVLGGAGYDTTRVDDGYAHGSLNTYLNVNSGKTVSAFEVDYMGALCTLSVGLDSSLSEMLHINFAAAGGVDAAYWHDGQSAVQFKQTVQVSPTPFTSDDYHTFRVEIDGNYVFCSIDGNLVAVAFDAIVPTLQGTWVFTQIHDGGSDEKISGVRVFNTAASAYKNLVADVASMICETLNVNDVSPLSSISLKHRGHTDPVTIRSDGHVVVNLKGEAAGASATINLESFLGVVTQVTASGDGSASISHGNAVKIKLDFAGNVILPSLPSASAGLPSGALWSDSGTVKRIA